MKALGIVLLMGVVAFNANAWMDGWVPEVKSVPAEVGKLPKRSVERFVRTVKSSGGNCSEGELEMYANYSVGGTLDLNGDGINDFVFIVPWMGNGLNACGSDVYFIVSGGKGGRMENVIECYGAEMSDLVKISGKTYFRHSKFFGELEKSSHSHWVSQMFAFGKDGIMSCANDEVGKPFPAVTIYYDKARFKPVELTAADLKKIAEDTEPVSKPYIH